MFTLLASLFCLALSSKPALAADPSSSAKNLKQAIEQLNTGHEQQAYELLQSIPVEAPEYALALPEIQKLHYKNKSWDLFFGHAAFYKAKLLNSFFEPKLLLLESLALIKHCDFESAAKILELAKSKTNLLQNPVATEQMQEIENLLYLQAELGKPVSTTPQKNKVKAFTKQLQWNVSNDKQFELIRKAVKHPRGLRVYVKDACAQQIAKSAEKATEVAEGTCVGKDCQKQPEGLQ